MGISALKTKTGEPYQPCRVNYDIYDHLQLESILEQLQCMVPGNTPGQWQWLLDYEARRLRFQRIYRKIPYAQRPVVLGNLQRQADRFWLTLYSFDRLLQGILFFDKHIPRTVAKATHMQLVNYFSDENDIPKLPDHRKIDRWFEQVDVQPDRSQEVLSNLETIIEKTPNLEERQALVTAYLEKIASVPRPDVEQLPINFYEDGEVSLQVVLNTRRAEAEAQWQSCQG
jgi:hypothetical protein